MDYRILQFDIYIQADIFCNIDCYSTHNISAMSWCANSIYPSPQVPGSLILNIFAGAVFGITRALPLVTILTICGTSLCYALSHLFGRLLALRLFGQRVARVRNVMKNHRSDLMIYLISLRLFPFTPNFLLNLVSPHIGIPFRYFFMSVLVGLLPYNLITTKAGNLLGSLTNMADALDMSNLVQLIVLALVALIPTVFRKRFQAYASLDTPRAGSPKRDRHHKTR
uniref:VTT domain-containing protein n=1 Tax=Spongospora subterranea TaxID=70186 RepID=A0A0H5R0M7_9EUKA|eukprot:CRZ01309.1 hypothetical protein [Spongospora subterranea]